MDTFTMAAGRIARPAVRGNLGTDAYATCTRTTRRTDAAFEETLRANLPANTSRTIARQHAELLLDLAELRRRRYGLTPDSGTGAA